MADLTDIT